MERHLFYHEKYNMLIEASGGTQGRYWINGMLATQETWERAGLEYIGYVGYIREKTWESKKKSLISKPLLN